MKKSFLVFILIFATNFVIAQENLFVQNPDLENFDFSTGNLSAEDFLTAAFIASGLNLENSLVYLEKAENLFNQFKNQYLVNQNSGDASNISGTSINTGENSIINLEENAKNALLFLYENLFTKYSELQTLVNVSFDNGTYNCVSSDVIYVYFAKKLNLNVVSVETPEHAFCTIYYSSTGLTNRASASLSNSASAGNQIKKVDVETTNPYGYNPGQRQNLAQKNTWVVTPQRKYRNRHEISDARLISLIYNNRISALQRQRKNLEASHLAFDALYVQNNSKEAQNLFFHCIENHIADLENLRQRDEAIKFMRQAIFQFGRENLLNKNISAVVNNKIGELLKSKQIQESYEFLNENKDLISEKEFLDLNEFITLNYLNDLSETENFDFARENLEKNKQNLSARNYSNLFVQLYSKEADRISKENLLEAVDFLENAMAENKNSNLQNQRNVYLHNFEVSVHNRAVNFINAGNYDEAKKIIEDALGQIENSRILKNDLNRLQRIEQ